MQMFDFDKISQTHIQLRCIYMSYFLHLPSELLARTFSRVNQSSLKSLRQTCRFTSQLSTDRLYRTLHLRPDETSQNKIREILNTPNLREIPRKIYFDTLEDGFVRSAPCASSPKTDVHRITTVKKKSRPNRAGPKAGMNSFHR